MPRIRKVPEKPPDEAVVLQFWPGDATVAVRGGWLTVRQEMRETVAYIEHRRGERCDRYRLVRISDQELRLVLDEAGRKVLT